MDDVLYSNLNPSKSRQRTLVGACYELYVFFLLLGSVGLNFLPQFLRQYFFTSTSTVFLYIGVFTIFLSGRGTLRIPIKAKILLYMLVYIILANLIMATVLYPFIGTRNSETTFSAILGTTYHWIEAIIAVIYNIICLLYYVEQQSVFKLIILSSAISLGVGILQQGVYFEIPGFSAVYSSLEDILNLANYRTVQNRGFSCFGSEPASAGRYILLAFPALFCSIRYFEKTVRKIWFRILLFALTLLFFTSTSSTVIILLVVFLCTALVCLSRKNPLLRIWLVSVFGFGFVYVLFYTFGHPECVSVSLNSENTFVYNLLGKAFDTTNQSTAHRISSVIVDMRLFFSEFFFTGVGSGIQGFFYNQYVPNWCLISSETRALVSGEVGISNGGGSFFPVVLSAFGFIGICVFGTFVKKYIHMYKNAQDTPENRAWKTFFILGIAGFLLDGWFSSGITSNQPVAFLLAIPFVL